jgi:crotonobetainyl-CoA:carnitine CoA-transferase CaiB-like acyl-CoA transferase
VAAAAAGRRTADPVKAPLDGILVADFTRVLAGPLATMTLADLGAEVVKVERPGTGDDTRQWGPPWTGEGSSYFECVNRSKQSLTLDLRSESDLAVARALVAGADVLVENFLTGTMDRLGLGYEEVAALNPRLVYCSITGFGSDAGAALPGYDFLVQALGGLMSITGEAEGEPTKVGVALVDVLTGKDATIGILAALQERERSGRGQRIEVNLLSSLLGALANQASAYLTTGVAPARMGNRHPSIAPYETLRCADGMLAVACGNDGQFARICAVLDRPDLAADPRFATNPARVSHRPTLIEALEMELTREDVSVWAERLTAVGVAAGAVNDLGGALELASRLGLSPTMCVGVGHPDQVRHPVTWSRSPLRTPTPPPTLGEHSTVLRTKLEDTP